MRDLQKPVRRLSEASRRDYANPYEKIDWPDSLEPSESWCMSEELLSLYGTPVYEALSEEEKRRASFFEAVNFFSLNIHGERALMEGLAHRLWRKSAATYTEYLHHFLDEENKHMVYFGTFCSRYAGKIYPDRKMIFPREFSAGEEDFLFFAKVMVFEEIVDVYNLRMSRDDRLHPVARTINELHHLDETRHLAFGRLLVPELFAEHSPSWDADTLQNVRSDISNYFLATWKEYYNPDVYRDLGLEKPLEIQRQAMEHEASRTRRREIASTCVSFLLEHEILLEEPEL